VFVVITSEWQVVNHERVFREIANVYGPFINRLAADKFRSKYCYESVACVRPLFKERNAEQFESQVERKKGKGKK
jgi:hypothetical protein